MGSERPVEAADLMKTASSCIKRPLPSGTGVSDSPMDERGERPAKMNGFPKIMIRNDGAGTGHRPAASRGPGAARLFQMLALSIMP